jgi:hypothetical protein
MKALTKKISAKEKMLKVNTVGKKNIESPIGAASACPFTSIV